MIKKFLAIMLLLASFGYAQAQNNGPRPSPAGSVTAEVGMTTIKIDYFRPKMKGRKIFGEKDALVPYGKIWRTGANSGTKISFSEDVTIEGKPVAKGEYLLLTWPGKDEWTIALNKDTALGGRVDNYDAAKDAAKFSVKPGKLTEAVESLTFNVSDLSEDSTKANVQLAWENTSVKFEVVVKKSW